MPIEYSILEKAPEPIYQCPACFHSPFRSFMRGIVQRGKRSVLMPWRTRPYCSIICDYCKEIVGHEEPTTGKFEIKVKYLKG
jgi:hypothetical protein